MENPSGTALGLAEGYATHSLSDATRRAYAADWHDFHHWCYASRLDALPASPETIAAYLASLAATRSRATVRRRLQGIGRMHKLKGHPWMPSHPLIRNTLKGMFRRHGKPQVKAAAIGTAEINILVSTCGNDLHGARDRALFLLGYAGALRRSELVAVRREDILFTDDGMRLSLPRAKTDQAGVGVEIGIPRGRGKTCPVRAIETWIRLSSCLSGPIFRKVNAHGRVEDRRMHPGTVSLILRRRAGMAGLAIGNERLSSHGLRAGFVTEAYKAGARDEEIMSHTRHRDLNTMRGYVRRAKLVTGSPVKLLGL